VRSIPADALNLEHRALARARRVQTQDELADANRADREIDRNVHAQPALPLKVRPVRLDQMTSGENVAVN
jgi:hypothetical protein